MTRRELEHIIRAAAATIDGRDIVVIGSQAIHGSLAQASAEFTESMGADVFPKQDPRLSIVIENAIGELSMFHDTFGYYAHGVDQTTATLAPGWQDRLVRLESPRTMGAVGWCLELHDLAVGKLAAGRDKHFAYVEAMLRRSLIGPDLVRERLNQTADLRPDAHSVALGFLDRVRRTTG